MGDPIDTFPLRDQRHMIGPVMSGDLEQVEEARRRWVETNGGYPIRRRLGDHSTDERRSNQRIAAYVSAGKWIASCPKCNDGVAAWPFVERGVCLGCGTAFRIDYPPETEIRQAVQALSLRPAELMHWDPRRGERAKDLHDENRRIGLRPGRMPALGDGQLVSVGQIRERLGAEAVERLVEGGVIL